jgi:hypothetical protein
MPHNESVDFFLRFLGERFQAFRAALNSFLHTLALEDRAKKLDTAQAVLASLDDLKRAMSANDHPNWIAPLEQKLNWYRKHAASQADAGLQVINAVLQLNPSIESQKWNFADSASNSAIDFAAIYQEYYKGSRVPELFDELVTQLQQIIATGEIDSLTTIKALEKLIATIRKNARGDYFSTRGAWEFTQLFFKNLSIELLENIPGLKHAVKAVRKTMSELDLEMSQVHDQVKQKLTESVSGDLPMLEYKPLALPAPKSKVDQEAS